MSAIIQPGLMKHTLYLQELTESFGNPGSWANVTTNPGVRCSMKHLSGAEPTSASGEQGNNKIELMMRYRADVKYDSRFSNGSTPERVFDIVSIVNVDELDHKLIVIVEERTRSNG